MPHDRLTVGLDTSCLVPLFGVWHTFHEVTLAELEDLRRRNVRFVVPVHALLECFSVLTRLPEENRFSAPEALRLLTENFSRGATVPSVDPEAAWACMQSLATQGPSGGRIYDAVIAHSAYRAGATVLLTWNLKDFLAVAPPGLEIRQPGGSPAPSSPVH